MMEKTKTVKIDNRILPVHGERNLLEIARKAGIEIPTFCYHSALSVYGACRLCLVDIEGRGIAASCSTTPEPGMVVRTHTDEIRSMRKIGLELLLANHDRNCTTCGKSMTCELQKLTRMMGLDKIRFKSTVRDLPIDTSSPSLIRDPNKCVLCGDCVRACAEIQSVGAIDFAHRGALTCVLPAFGKNLSEVECVYCGLCASVCPTGSLTPKPEIDGVWKAINDPKKTVVAQIAPAVRVAIGEAFGLEAGSIETGRTVAALKALGFNYVFDTSFTADMTVIEEAAEFISRKQKGERLPQFTSCCPAWVKFAEQFYPDLIPNLSSCRSPQQMFGSVAREVLPSEYKIAEEDLVVVSIMPCTAKKYEASLPKFKRNGRREVDYVLTTQELARMIEEGGIQFQNLEPQSMDMPLGFKTGAGVIFGASGGVTEAVLRYAVEKLQGTKLDAVAFEEVRGEEGVKEATLEAGGIKLRLAVVNGLRNARMLADKVRRGETDFDLIEVMACPGGCVGGAGQPVQRNWESRSKRAKGLYNADTMLLLHKPQDNHMLQQCYRDHLGDIGGHKAHELLHTSYQNRRRISREALTILGESSESRLKVAVCVGTNCFVKGSDSLLRQVTAYVQDNGLADKVNVEATFCLERCGHAPNVRVGPRLIESATVEKVCAAIEEGLGEQMRGPLQPR